MDGRVLVQIIREGKQDRKEEFLCSEESGYGDGQENACVLEGRGNATGRRTK
jgi:hypothetical protein